MSLDEDWEEEPTAEYPVPETMAEAIDWWTSLWREREPTVIYQLGTE